jgi:hypothetical protein
MLDNSSHIKIKSSSEKNFGLTFSLVFFIIACYFFYYKNIIHISLFSTSIIFLFLGTKYPRSLKYPNFLWNKLGFILGSIISPIVMFSIYIFVLLPTSLFIRFFKNDLIEQKIDIKKNTYWNDIENDTINFEDQF